MQNGTNVPASVGGPKLVGVDLQTNSIFATIIFPSNVVYADSVGFSDSPGINAANRPLVH